MGSSLSEPLSQAPRDSVSPANADTIHSFIPQTFAEYLLCGLLSGRPSYYAPSPTVTLTHKVNREMGILGEQPGVPLKLGLTLPQLLECWWLRVLGLVPLRDALVTVAPHPGSPHKCLLDVEELAGTIRKGGQCQHPRLRAPL